MIINRLGLIAFFIAVLASTQALSASKEEIDKDVKAAIDEFYQESQAGKALAEKASGMLVFPKVIKAGFGVGGEYGEGALLVKGKAVEYYSTASASIGFQLGAQQKGQVILFMNDDVLKQFRDSDGWEAGVDGSVAVAEIGAGGDLSTNTAQEPIIGCVFSNKGLMYNLTFEGTRFTRIRKE